MFETSIEKHWLDIFGVTFGVKYTEKQMFNPAAVINVPIHTK